MGSINPNPPPAVDAVVTGLQTFYAYNCRNINSMGLAAAAGNATGVTTVGTTVFPGVYDLTNSTTRIPRQIQNTTAAAESRAGLFVQAAIGNPQACVFPGASGDAGYRTRMVCGFDALLGSAASTTLIMGLLPSTGSPPGSAQPLTTLALAWIGLYNLGDGNGLRFGYKHVGSAVPVQLDQPSDGLAALWNVYRTFYIDITFDPRGPVTRYSVATMNAAGDAFDPVIVGSTTAFNPGRICLPPYVAITPLVINNQSSVFVCDITMISNPFGIASL